MKEGEAEILAWKLESMGYHYTVLIQSFGRSVQTSIFKVRKLSK